MILQVKYTSENPVERQHSAREHSVRMSSLVACCAREERPQMTSSLTISLCSSLAAMMFRSAFTQMSFDSEKIKMREQNIRGAMIGLC